MMSEKVEKGYLRRTRKYTPRFAAEISPKEKYLDKIPL